jgi:hypothetical protein
VLDAKLGSAENVLNAQPDGILIIQEFANLFQNNADHGLQLANANHAIQVTSYLQDNASSILTHSSQLLMIFALFGAIEYALNALIELSSILMEFVGKLVFNVQPGINLMVFAYHAIMDIIWSRDNVLKLQSLNQLIWDAKFGIGIIKYV